MTNKPEKSRYQILWEISELLNEYRNIYALVEVPENCRFLDVTLDFDDQTLEIDEGLSAELIRIEDIQEILRKESANVQA